MSGRCEMGIHTPINTEVPIFIVRRKYAVISANQFSVSILYGPVAFSYY